MTEYRYSYGEKLNISPSVLALGFFDGVHIGHRELLRRAKRRAEELGILFGIFTFESDSKIKQGIKRLYKDDTKAKLFSQIGADFVIFADFESVSGLSPEQFVADVLVGTFKVRCAVCGYNYRFGTRASASATDLDMLMRAHGAESIICDRFEWGGDAVSTTRIRELMKEGNIKEANTLLGAPYSIFETVKRGNGVGHSLGYPTVNIPSPKPFLLRRGVYASAVNVGGKLYKALSNVGTCPTFPEREEHVETYILDFDRDLYG